MKTSRSAERVHAFDLARGLAILFMVAVHALQTYATDAVYASGIGVFIEFLGGPPAAPVFMFVMGAALAFSRRASFGPMLRRGLLLLVLGYALNGLRGALPLWVAIQSGVSLAELGGASPISELLQVDILQFAGMAYILLAVIRRILRSPWMWLVLAFAIAAGSPWLWGRMSGFAPLDGLLTLLWGLGGEAVAFPVFPWLAYPLVGMAVGTWLAGAEDRDRIFRALLSAGAGLFIFGTGITMTNIGFHLGDYWRSGPGGLIAITGFVFLWLSGCHALAARILKTKVFGLLSVWSRWITVLYVIHWVLLGWSVLVVGYGELNLIGVLIGFVLVILTSDLLTRGWIRLRQRRAV